MPNKAEESHLPSQLVATIVLYVRINLTLDLDAQVPSVANIIARHVELNLMKIV